MYPTKEEILETEIHFKDEVIEVVKLFKKKWVNARKTIEQEQELKIKKQKLITELIDNLGTIHGKKANVTFDENEPNCYNPITKTININKTLSIVTTMHEFAHHLFGSSEKKACMWSIWLFKKTFPVSYKNLKWDKHMIIKQKKEQCPNCGREKTPEQQQCEHCQN